MLIYIRILGDFDLICMFFVPKKHGRHQEIFQGGAWLPAEKKSFFARRRKYKTEIFGFEHKIIGILLQ